MRLHIAGLAVALLPVVGSSPPTIGTVEPGVAASAGESRCRCAERTLERYFEDAEIVVVARVDEVRAVEGDADRAARIEVAITPLFNQRRPFKGSVDGVVLATTTNSAACGVPVLVGRQYVIFASRDAGTGVAWFTTCSGSRSYPVSDRPLDEAYLGVLNNRVVSRLFELAGLVEPRTPPEREAFHTSPACWSGPRIYHDGTPPKELRDRVAISWVREAPPDSGGTLSPNGAYEAWTLHGGPGGLRDSAAVVLIDVERPERLLIETRDLPGPPEIRWVNEKILFLRIPWGRIVYTDLLVDVETGAPIYEDGAVYGGAAFEQFREACLGQCPCLARPGASGSLPEPPAHRPAPGEESGLEPLAMRSLAYLDDDWDGRVFTVAGGREYTVSELRPGAEADIVEVPADVLSVEEVDGVWWLEVVLYRDSRCGDSLAPPMHRGWVPAFSPKGRLVASTWPGGC